MSRRVLVRRIINALVTIAFIAVANFILFRLIPGDPTRALLPRNVSAEERAALRDRLGLDQPLLPGVVRQASGRIELDLSTLPASITQNQLVTYFGNLLQWPPDLGDSFAEPGTVVDAIAERFWPTVLLVGVAELVALALGVAIGIIAGWKRGGIFDTVSVSSSLVLYAVPLFWLGMLLLFFLATSNGIPIFPEQQMTTPGRVYGSAIDEALDIGAHLVLPATTLALGLVADYVLIMRSSLVEVLTEEYITTARAKGLSEGNILRRHALPNAWLPTVSLVALSLGYVLGGAIGVETVFAWPGLGRLTIDSVAAKDFPVLQGLFLLIAISVVLANLVAEIIYGMLDPRVRQ